VPEEGQGIKHSKLVSFGNASLGLSDNEGFGMEKPAYVDGIGKLLEIVVCVGSQGLECSELTGF